jgi:hypothetical protein
LKTKLLFSVFVVFILMGCAQKKWTKPGAGQRAFHQDKLACQQEAREAQKQTQESMQESGVMAGAAAGAASGAYNDTFNSCMMAKGWRLE